MKSFLHRLRASPRDKENVKEPAARPLSLAGAPAPDPLEKDPLPLPKRERVRHSTGPTVVGSFQVSSERRRGLAPDKRTPTPEHGKDLPSIAGRMSPLRTNEGDLSPLWSEQFERFLEDGQPGADHAVKKVAFVSPRTTPAPSMVMDSIPDLPTPPEPPAKAAPVRPPAGRRAQSHAPTTARSGLADPAPAPRSASLSTTADKNAPSGPSRSAADRLASRGKAPPRSASSASHALTKVNEAAEPGPRTTSIDTQATSQSHAESTAPRAGAFCAPQASWSEMAEDDLIDNLSPRERTRQEVLWEIVSSEDRYVQELAKLKATFIDALIPPAVDTTPVIPSLSSPALSAQSDERETWSHAGRSTVSPIDTLSDDLAYLPIASRFASPRPDTPEDSVKSANGAGRHPGNQRVALLSDVHRGKAPDQYAYLTHGRPSTQDLAARYQRAHHSLPPPPRSNIHDSAQQHSVSLAQARMSLRPAQSQAARAASQNRSPPMSAASTNGRTGKLRKRVPSASSGELPIPPALPEELKKVLDILGQGILQGHMALSAALKKRYDTQYPLVRSLADVFIAHSSLLRQYETYVLNLERALQQIEESVAATAGKGQASARDSLGSSSAALGRALQVVEDIAADRGETGLVISLSKPFQRLLKYPLLFQNLLFHTDPSTKEYEATLGMVEEVETIVRNIEDQKANKEIRDKTRDVFARIEGLEAEKGLMAPKATRLLVEEHAQEDGESESQDAALRQATIRDKRSMKRLSDLLKGHGSKTAVELWIVSFTDVSLLCQKTGTTSLPLGSSNQKTAEKAGKKGKDSGHARKTQLQSRNLYKFLKVEEWFVQESAAFRHGLLNMSEISRLRSGDSVHMPTPGSPTDEEAGTESDESDSYSLMSFAFGASDQLRPVPLAHRRAGNGRTSRMTPTTPIGGRLTAPTFSSMQRRSSTGIAKEDAKFGHRLRSPEPVSIASRPADRVRSPLATGGTTAPPARTTRLASAPGTRPAAQESRTASRASAAPPRAVPKAPGKRI